MEHQEIRLRLLYSLYKKHYSDQLGHLQQTDKAIEESGLSSVSRSDIYGDVVYLKDKGLIKGESPSGYAYPLWIVITSHGIDTVENGVNIFIRNVDKIDVDAKIKTEIQTISKTEDSTSTRIMKVVNFLERHQALISLANEIARIASGHL
jgi:hypothetical protein